MNTIVDTNYGKLEGFEKDGLILFRGIPYAKPPVGELRFKRAKEIEKWEGTLSCKEFGNKCLQFGGGKHQAMQDSDTPASEDCLFMNIWTKNNNKNKPVFVWIHGGGNYCGESSDPSYDLSALAKDNIVCVSFNYRLGVLGFYDFTKYNKAFESNCAISDMIMALKWVKENISNFGGNPNNVTLCGESAGGTSVMALLAAPTARDYFNRAIIMSGLLDNLIGKKIADYNNEIFFEETNISKENIKDLLTTDYETLRKGCACRFEKNKEGMAGMLMAGPVIDDLVTQSPLEALASGKLSNKEIMIGTCKNEGGLLDYLGTTFPSWNKAMEVLIRNGYVDRIDDFTKMYQPGPSGSQEERMACMKFNTDLKFWRGSLRLAIDASKHNSVYMYRFDYTTPISRLLKMGATHTMDITAAFKIKGTKLYKYAFDSFKVKNNLHNAFVQFIYTGNPNKPNKNDWLTFDDENRYTMLVNTKMKLINKPRTKFYELWKDIELD